MKRGGPLRRKAPMKPGKALKGGQKALGRSKLKAKGKAAKRERCALQNFREEVLRRAGGQCERKQCGSFDGVQAHHLVPRGRARGHPLLHDPRNGRALCGACHNEVHFAPTCADRQDWIKPPRFLETLGPVD